MSVVKPFPATSTSPPAWITRTGDLTAELCRGFADAGGFERVALFLDPDGSGQLIDAGEQRVETRAGDVPAAPTGPPIVFPLTDEGRRVGMFLAYRADDADGVVEPAGAALAAFAAGAVLALRSRLRPMRLARQLHDTVSQRLAGVAYLLGADDGELEPHERALCREQLDAATAELHDILESALQETALRAAAVDPELAALRHEHPAVRIDDRSVLDALGDDLDPVVEAFVAEGLRNVRKHASPQEVRIELRRDARAVTVDVLNDGALPGRGRRGSGLGLRLLTSEASLVGGHVASGAEGDGQWRHTLTMPLRAC